MTYIEKVVDAFLKMHNANAQSCASYLQVSDGHLNEMMKKIVTVTGHNSALMNSQADGYVKQAFYKMFPSVMADVKAPCFASFQRFMAYIQPVPNIREHADRIKHLREKDVYKILPKREVLLSRCLTIKAPKYIVLFPHLMQKPSYQSTVVYNLLLEEPWIKEHLYRKENSYDLHMKEGCILKVEDATIQKMFGVCMALRMCLEHPEYVGQGFRGLVAHGFPPKIAARLSMYIGPQKEGHMFKTSPEGHSFAWGGHIHDSRFEACLKDEWVLPWRAMPKWKDQTKRESFNLNKTTSSDSYPHKPPEASSYITKVKEGWYTNTFVDVKKLKEKFNAQE